MTEQPRKAVVLLSGGLDSTTVLAMANASGYESYALSFAYGQRHSWELECARKIAADLIAELRKQLWVRLHGIEVGNVQPLHGKARDQARCFRVGEHPLHLFFHRSGLRQSGRSGECQQLIVGARVP